MKSKSLTVVAVTGANSGLGKAIVAALKAVLPEGTSMVLSLCGEPKQDMVDERWPASTECFCDLALPSSNEVAAIWIKERTEEFLETFVDYGKDDVYSILINCAGINYIDWFDQADFAKFDELMGINVKAGLMLIQNLIGKKPPVSDHESYDWFGGSGAILNIVSNASHVPMTNSAFYNASKGAFHIATLALARELRKTHGICVFGISPNKLSGTGMSSYIEDRVPSLRGWTPEEAAKYQISALPSGEETDPATLAEFIAFLLSKPERHKYLTNTVIPYGA